MVLTIEVLTVVLIRLLHMLGEKDLLFVINQILY